MPNQRELTIGDLLKSEADYQSRIHIDAADVKAGQLVMHPSRGEPLVALSNSEHGKVLVQPHNCVIYLNNVAEADISKIEVETPTEDGASTTTTPMTVEMLISQGDKYGIKYIGTPYTS